MLSAIALSMFLISTSLQGTDAQQGEDMTDEEYRIYAQEHKQIFDHASRIIWEKRHEIMSGAVGGYLGHAMRTALRAHPGFVAIATGGGIEIAKSLYRDTFSEPDLDKEERLIYLENMVHELSRELRKMDEKYDRLLNQELEREIERVADINRQIERANREMEHRESIKVSDARDAGPHRESYREYREPSTREIRDTIDRIYRDSVSSREKEYVTRR